MKRDGGAQLICTSEHGFTVVELVTVIVVVSILVLTVTAKYFDLSASAERATCIKNQIALETAQTIFFAEAMIHEDGGRYAASLDELLPYLGQGTDPVCPAGGEYQLHANGAVSCSSPDHSRE